MRRPIVLILAALFLISAPTLAAPMPQGTGGCGCCQGAQADQPAGQARSMGGGMCSAMGAGQAAAGGGHCARADQAADAPRRMGGGHAMGNRRAGGPADHFEVMDSIHFLIDHHNQIVREVEEIEGGVLTTTRSPGRAELASEIQTHVREMWNLLESGSAIRRWDPLFREIFAHADQIELTYEDLEDGIRVREVSADPEVTALIRAHAAKVDEFVARGRAAMHEETPLPTP